MLSEDMGRVWWSLCSNVFYETHINLLMNTFLSAV